MTKSHDCQVVFAPPVLELSGGTQPEFPIPPFARKYTPAASASQAHLAMASSGRHRKNRPWSPDAHSRTYSSLGQMVRSAEFTVL